MSAVVITTAIALAVAVIGGLAGIRQFAEYLQTNAKAHSDVESLQRDLSEVNDRLTALEGKVDRLEKDNTSLIEQNTILIHQTNELHLQNQELTKQNGSLLALLGVDDSSGED